MKNQEQSLDLPKKYERYLFIAKVHSDQDLELYDFMIVLLRRDVNSHQDCVRFFHCQALLKSTTALQHDAVIRSEHTDSTKCVPACSIQIWT